MESGEVYFACVSPAGLHALVLTWFLIYTDVVPVAKFRGDGVPRVFDLICTIYVCMREIYWCGSESAVWEIVWRNIYWCWYWFCIFLTRVITFQLHSKNLFTAICMLSEGTLTFIPSANSETDTLFCHSTCFVCHIQYAHIFIHTQHTNIVRACVCMYVLNNVGRNRLPSGIPAHFRELLWRIYYLKYLCNICMKWAGIPAW
jgi:hypothetical protein